MKTTLLPRLAHIRGSIFFALLSFLTLLAYSGCTNLETCLPDEQKKASLDYDFTTSIEIIIQDSVTQEPIISPFHDVTNPKFFDVREISISSSSGTLMRRDTDYTIYLSGRIKIHKAFDAKRDFRGDLTKRSKEFWILFEDKYNRDIDTIGIDYFSHIERKCTSFETHFDSVQFFFNKKLVHRSNERFYDVILINKS